MKAPPPGEADDRLSTNQLAKCSPARCASLQERGGATRLLCLRLLLGLVLMLFV